MVVVRWTKQQDFCLRLGLLRALLAVLPTHGRSVDRGPILRKLDSLLFGTLRSLPELQQAATRVLGKDPDTVLAESSKRNKLATLADGLLITSGSPSWGQPIDARKSAKILEWGHATGLVGAGNQITERGQLLRSFFPDASVAAFCAGQVCAWNPFEMGPAERAFLFYHLGELDEVLWQVATSVGCFGQSIEVTASLARRLTADAITRLLDRAHGTAPVNEMPKVRVIRELASIISAEVADDPQAQERLLRRRRGPGRRMKLAVQRGEQRRTTKNADHQAIPRFEILVDLGLLTKRVPPLATGKELWEGRNAWSYVTTPAAARLAEYLAGHAIDPVAPWHWHHFSAACNPHLAPSPPTVADATDVADLWFDSYDRVQRRAGHTPFESVALLAMVKATERGKVLEIGQLHRAFLDLKRSGVLGDAVYFAAGNEVNRMFILLKPNARDALRGWLSSHWPPKA